MRRAPLARSARFLVLPILLAACGGTADPGGTAGQPSPTDDGPIAAATGEAIDPPASSGAPDADAWLPREPERLAERLTRTTRALLEEIEAWRASGRTGTWPPPRRVVLLALDQQRSIQLLAASRDRRVATIAAVPPALRSVIRDAAEAGAALRAGIGRVGTDAGLEMRTRAPLPPDVLLGHYREAAGRFGVRWEMLAAVNFLETKFGRVVSNSWAGAQGPMQFIPSTWAAYGMGGDVRDPRDAIHGAANYLAANGAPAEPRRALWAYNPVAYYGEAVMAYERMIRRDPRMFYALYAWQVFVRTSSGTVQLTGPGADVRSST